MVAVYMHRNYHRGKPACVFAASTCMYHPLHSWWGFIARSSSWHCGGCMSHCTGSCYWYCGGHHMECETCTPKGTYLSVYVHVYILYPTKVIKLCMIPILSLFRSNNSRSEDLFMTIIAIVCHIRMPPLWREITTLSYQWQSQW